MFNQVRKQREKKGEAGVQWLRNVTDHNTERTTPRQDVSLHSLGGAFRYLKNSDHGNDHGQRDSPVL